MRVLMLGWEFPPFITGGLGTACYGLTKAMSEAGTEVLFVLPKPVQTEKSSHVTLVTPKHNPVPGSTTYRLEEFEHVTFAALEAGQGVYAYMTPEERAQQIAELTRKIPGKAFSRSENPSVGESTGKVPAKQSKASSEHYGGSLFGEVEHYAHLAKHIADHEKFDVVHAHDWMTYRAGVEVSRKTGKPLVVHVHSTEFDRSGIHVNQRIYDIEREGMHTAQKIIAVSHLTRNTITARYGIEPERVEVVHNAVDFNGYQPQQSTVDIGRDEKIVLFLGRITMQKGPEYFLEAAKKVLDHIDNVRFVMAGAGDMTRRIIEKAASMGIGHKVLFTGFLRGGDVERVFRMADLYVMPSVSEPFGIAPLEAMQNNVPVIISKQSGVSEILNHALKVDFWDVNEMANKIIAVLKHPSLQRTLREYGRFEVRRLSWADSAKRCLQVYQQAVAEAN